MSEVPNTCDRINEDGRTLRCGANTRIPLAGEAAFRKMQKIEQENKKDPGAFQFAPFDGCVRNPKQELGENNPLWCGPGSFNEANRFLMLCDEGTWIKEDNEFVCRTGS